MLDEIIAFAVSHASWTFPIMFVTAFGESFVFVSLAFPGTTILIAAGLLIPKGILPLFPVLAGAILGAILGDFVSWWLGYRYAHRIATMWPLSSNPQLLERSERFFRRYGVASVFFGRFFGPLRATVPLMAGMLEMPARPFWIANVASAFIWAPALLIPGSVAAALLEWDVISLDEKLAILAGALAVLGGGYFAMLRAGWLNRLEDPR